MDVATLNLRANSSELDRASRSLGTLEKSARKTETATERLNRENERAVRQYKEISNTARIAKAAIAGIGVAFAGIAIRGVVSEMRAFETGLIGVAKTTGLGGAELQRYALNITKLSQQIPASTAELLDLSQAAGQMGVKGTANLEKFTLTVAKLGRASDISGEIAAKSLARILNVTGEAISEVDTLASVIVSLGNNTAASESEIVRMTTEVARATGVFGVSSAEATALGAAMKSIGIQAELGGSSVGRAMQEITSRVRAGGDELQDFADTLGLNADRLSQLFESDKIAAFQYFLEAVGKLGLDAGNALDAVNLGGQEIAKTIVPLAGNMDIFAQTLALANAEVKNATALDAEFNATLGTLDNRVIVFTNNIKALGLAIGGSSGTSSIGGAIGVATDSVRYLTDNIDTAIQVLGLAGVAITSKFAGPTIAAFAKSSVAQASYLSQLATGNVVTINSARANAERALAVNASAIADVNAAKSNAQKLASEVAAYRAVMDVTRSELALEQVRLKAQISAEGRRLSVNRMVIARQELAAATAALTRIEQQHAAALAGITTAQNAATASASRLAAAQTAASASTRAMMVAGNTLRGTMALFGGPAGVFITAVAAVYIFRDSILDLIDPLNKAERALDSLRESQSKMASDPFMDATVDAIKIIDKELDKLAKEVAVYGAAWDAASKANAKIADQEFINLSKIREGHVNVLTMLELRGKREEIQLASLDDLNNKTDENNKKNKEQAETIAKNIAALKKQIIQLKDGERALFALENAYDKAALAAYDNVESLKADKKATEEAREAKKKYTDQLQDLTDKIYPQAAAVRQLMGEYLLLNQAINNGDATQKSVHDWLDVAVAIDTTKRSAVDLKDEADPLAEAWQEALNRIDEAFVDLWKSAFDGFKDFGETLKNAFIQLLAELAHRATTQKILISMGLDYGGGGLSQGGGVGQSSDGGLGDLMSLGSLAKGLDSLGAGVTSLADVMGANLYTSNAGYYGGQIGGAMGLEGLSANAQVGLGTIANAVAGYAGAWVGTNVGESLFNKEAESAWGATIGSAIGSIWGPWFAALGGAIGGLIDAAAGGDGLKRVSLGVLTEPGAQNNQNLNDVLGTTVQTASGLELSTYTKRVGEEGKQVAETLLAGMAVADAAITSIFSNAMGSDISGILRGQALGGGQSAGAGENWPDTFFGSAEFNDVSQEDLVNASDDFIRSLVDRLNEVTAAGLDLQPIYDRQREGEALVDVLMRVAQNFGPVQTTLESIGLAAYEASASGMAMADSLVALFGGLENFGAATSQYYQMFFSEEERLAKTATELQTIFGALNMSVPESVAGFRQIVEGLDLTTDEGQAVFATMMRIAPAFYQVATAQQEAASATDLLDDAANGLGDTLSDVAQKLISERQSLEVELLRAQGNGSAADAAQYLIDTAGMTEAEIGLFNYNEALRDQIQALNDAAETQQRIADERASIEAQISQLIDDTATLRERELAALDSSNQARQVELWALQDARAAAEAAAIAEQQLAAERDRISQETYAIESRLLQLQGDTSALRERELAALDPSNRALLEQIHALTDLAEAATQAEQATRDAAIAEQQLADERYGLEGRLLQAQGDVAALRERELSALNPANRSLLEEIFALEDLAITAEAAAQSERDLADERKRIESERYSLETQLLQLQGETQKLRERELELLDPSNRELQKEIWAIEDRNSALEESTRASEQFTASLSKLIDYAKDLKGIADSLRLSDLSPLTNEQRLQFSQSQFAALQVRAESGDESAYAQLGSAASEYLKEAQNYYASSQAYTRIFGEVTGYLDSLSAQLMSEAESKGYMEFASGGIADGPTGGYPVTLHGREMITPMDGSTIQVESRSIEAELKSVKQELAETRRIASESKRALERLERAVNRKNDNGVSA